ncbi:MAG: D-alanyl-D-alanine carboxypeptidase [Firmicutes bacterium]|nr:D-alanyl-D-alanine carboxypeptidase [Bacillota bacterium]MCL1954105.1 D-alanyl-D-alanine carboxypeptidase [Bacillota bacterium]
MKKIKVVFAGIISSLLILSILAISLSQSFALVAAPITEEALSKNAKAATLIDFDTGTVVFEKNVNDKYPIASMVKIMTLLLIMENIEAGVLSPNTEIPISENASSMGGSQAFLDANTTYKAGELIKSIVVASANDSCVAMAEHIAGTVDGFVLRMNDKAKALGMENSNFVNCTGLPAPNGYSTAKDVSIMMRALLRHQLFFDYASVWTFDFAHNSGRTTTLTNTNKLINAYKGCDGGKTGFTQEARYCLAATAKRGNTRLIAVVIGENDSKVRNFEISNLLNHGFGNYETRQFVFKDIPLQEFVVQRARNPILAIAPKDDYFYFSQKTIKPKIDHNITINKDKAPILKGEIVGTLTLSKDGKHLKQIDMVATINIDEVQFVDILQQIAEKW